MKKTDEWHRLADVDTATKTATCQVCGPVDIKIRVRSGRTKYLCMTPIREYRRDHQKKTRTTATQRKYRRDHAGQTMAQRQAAIQAQNGLCEICKLEKPLHADHDHATGRQRAMLCQRCNIMLGWANDDPGRLRDGADYLERYL